MRPKKVLQRISIYAVHKKQGLILYVLTVEGLKQKRDTNDYRRVTLMVATTPWLTQITACAQTIAAGKDYMVHRLG